MSIDVRPVVPRRHPSHGWRSTEGTSSLLADDAQNLPSSIADLELPPDIAMQQEGPEEMAEYDFDDVRPDHGEAEVEDTPGDDALIALARIHLFNDAHHGAAPVDAGPFDDGEHGTTDDASVAAVEDYTLKGKPRTPPDDL